MSNEAVIIPFPSSEERETRLWLAAEPEAIFSDEWMVWLMQD